MRWIIAALTSPRTLATAITVCYLYSFYMIIVVNKLPRVRLPYEVQLFTFVGFTWFAWYIAEHASDRVQKWIGFSGLYLLGLLSLFLVVKSI